MGKPTPISNVLAWPFLPPGNIACNALGLGERREARSRLRGRHSLLTKGRYRGNPVVRHLVIPAMKPQPFERWLALFEVTSREPFDDATSEASRITAERIAENLKLALLYGPHWPWPPEPSP